MKLLVGDTVVINTGKDKGATGTISKILPQKNQVVVEGVNQKTRNIKARGGQPGDRVEFFAPMPLSNVSLIDPETKKATRVGFKIEGGKKVRIAKASGKAIPGPVKVSAKAKKEEAPKKATSSKKSK